MKKDVMTVTVVVNKKLGSSTELMKSMDFGLKHTFPSSIMDGRQASEKIRACP